MSAYVVNPDTIDMLASAAARWNITVQTDAETVYNGRTSAAAIASLLHAENVKSVNYRYCENSDASHDYRPVVADAFTAVEVMRAASGLRYQSCEHPDYQESPAAMVLDAIERAAIRNLPGYDDAPREWTRAHGERNLAALRAAFATGGAR